jgi:hypothetical protein
MPCPTCGGTAREPIAPGYWRCASTRIVQVEVGGPGLTDPRLGPPVIRVPREVICGTRYAEGNGSEMTGSTCACGTFAIGMCAKCQTPVCGDHSALWDGRRLCATDFHEMQTLAEDRRREAVEKTKIEQQRRWDIWVDETRTQLSTLDLVEGLVRVVGQFVAYSSPGGHTWITPNWPVLQALLPDIFPEPSLELLLASPLWDDEAVLRWFVSTVRTPPTHPGLMVETKTLFGTKRRPTPGWYFERGAMPIDALTHLEVSGSNAGVGVLVDGRRYGKGGSGRVNAIALVQMARIIGMPALHPPALPE